MKPNEYKWSEWIRATWRGKVFEWKAGDFFGDEWADGIAALETANADLLEALEDVAKWIENGEWWVGSPFKGGLDGNAIDEAIRKHKGESDTSDLVAGLEHAVDLYDAIQERKAKENER